MAPVRTSLQGPRGTKPDWSPEALLVHVKGEAIEMRTRLTEALD